MEDRPPVPYFRAWVIYILAFAEVSIPLRCLLAWAAERLEAAPELGSAPIAFGAQMLAGVLLLPVSCHLFRWSVRRFVLRAG